MLAAGRTNRNGGALAGVTPLTLGGSAAGAPVKLSALGTDRGLVENREMNSLPEGCP
jgi:hypothetical protein